MSVNYTTDLSDCSVIMISLSDVFKLNSRWMVPLKHTTVLIQFCLLRTSLLCQLSTVCLSVCVCVCVCGLGGCGGGVWWALFSLGGQARVVGHGHCFDTLSNEFPHNSVEWVVYCTLPVWAMLCVYMTLYIRTVQLSYSCVLAWGGW